MRVGPTTFFTSATDSPPSLGSALPQDLAGITSAYGAWADSSGLSGSALTSSPTFGAFESALINSIGGLSDIGTVVDHLAYQRTRTSDPVFGASAGRISGARAMLKRHAALLTRVEQRFGVPREIIVAIWGLESDFGKGDTG